MTPYTILNREELPRDGHTGEFEGARYPHVDVSFIWVNMPPGEGVRLHKHPYTEVFIVEDGTSTFTVGSATLDVHGGQIVLVPAELPHKFVNSGNQPLRQIDIHASRVIVTCWLEE